MMVGLFLLAACATSGPATTAPAGGVADQPPASATVSLPAQTLEPGTCGLFLWTRDEPRHFILFFVAGAPTARAVLNGQEQALSVVSQKGDVFGQFLSRMILQTADGESVSLTLTPGEEIDGGRRVPLARMISKDGEGWEIITPLTGLTACQPE
jgi:hypothetical protein